MPCAQKYLSALPAAGLHGRARFRVAPAPVPVIVPMPVLVPVPSTTSFPCVRAVTVAVGVAVAGNKNSGVLLQVRQVPELVQIGVSQQLLLQAIFALRRCPCLALAALLCRHDETTQDARRKRTDEKHAFPKRTPSALSSRGGTHIFNFIAFEIYYNRQTLQVHEPATFAVHERPCTARAPTVCQRGTVLRACPRPVGHVVQACLPLDTVCEQVGARGRRRGHQRDRGGGGGRRQPRHWAAVRAVSGAEEDGLPRDCTRPRGPFPKVPSTVTL